MVVEAYVPSANQFIETGIEEIRIQVAEPLNDGFLNFGIGSEMATFQVLLQLSEEMKSLEEDIVLFRSHLRGSREEAQQIDAKCFAMQKREYRKEQNEHKIMPKKVQKMKILCQEENELIDGAY
ncbi:hypothetical protein AVEN_216033-1 [Araneus ventricosus]|uniref:Uncharacterized protein n=1 Tax=Araneus ventricosus TaxID=182803 RepID=A0A4Y2TX10_ARAVE|nr:hypothetical protein AVEN_216033-1 [Araneus ventricosus]